MTLRANPTGVLLGEPVTFTVAASNTGKVLTSASIDYQNDGIWDDTESHNQSSIVSTFSHTYANVGRYTVRAEVVDEDQEVTTRTTTVVAVLPSNRPITVVVRGLAYSGSSSLPICVAVGPPATCAGCTRELDATGVRISLGSIPSGTLVSVTQAFEQEFAIDAPATVAQDLPHACYFDVSLYAGPQVSEVLFGVGSCTTQPGALMCSTTASGRVP